MHRLVRTAAGVLAAALAIAAAAALLLGRAPTPAAAQAASVAVVAAESQYASVAKAVGGPYVRVTAVMDNPNVDPHTYEASTAVAAAVAGAELAIQNGVGYDAFMQKLEAASPNPRRLVVDAGEVAGYGARAKNPHLWYSPKTMPKVAAAIAADLARLLPAHKAYFQGRVKAFDAALGPWAAAVARLRAAYRGAPVAVTEPVADDMLQAAGLSIKTPWAFQAAVMNGTDISPQDVAIEESLLSRRRVRVLVYNLEAVDPTTTDLLAIARAHHIPVVGVYEIMPPHYTYPTWMTAETDAVYRALRDHVSTARLP